MSPAVNILALDTAMNGCGTCVYKNGESFSRSAAMPRGQAERLMPMMQEVMGEAGLDFKDLDAIVTTVGPGAFTGLRIGLSAAKALGLALEIPVFGITTLQALALQAQRAGRLAVLVETKRDDFYIQIFDREARPLSEAAAESAETIRADILQKPCLFIGDGVIRFRSMLSPGDLHEHVFDETVLLSDPAVMARVFAAQGPESGFFTEDPGPVYLRAPDVTLPKKPA